MSFCLARWHNRVICTLARPATPRRHGAGLPAGVPDGRSIAFVPATDGPGVSWLPWRAGQTRFLAVPTPIIQVKSTFGHCALSGASMTQDAARSRFKAKLLGPVGAGEGGSWAFLVLPKSVSAKLPRRGRTSVDGTFNGHPFRATLEPDGQLSHWLRVSKELREASGAEVGETVTLEVAPVANEPEPKLPPDLHNALAASPQAKAVWQVTTTVARIDWIHWIESAKQAATRKRRVENACDMLAAGKKRVCCFDPSGFYDKSLSAPQAAE